MTFHYITVTPQKAQCSCNTSWFSPAGTGVEKWASKHADENKPSQIKHICNYKITD